MTPNQLEKQQELLDGIDEELSYKLDCLAQDGLGDDIEYASPEAKYDQYLLDLNYLVKRFRNINKRLLTK